MQAVFEHGEPMYRLLEYLHLTDGMYQNPYDLVTFYDNHDMSRLNATDNNFINVNNWLFTSRGIPAVYYGSEVGFMRGLKEHYGNRNFFGQKNIDQALNHPIAQSLQKIANIRLNHIALQKGLQINLDFDQDHASFLRVYQHDERSQQALVLLNRGDTATTITLNKFLEVGTWQDVTLDQPVEVTKHHVFDVPANGVRVFIRNASVTDQALLAHLCTTPQAINCPVSR